jgi:hypothetical protein
VVFEQNQSKRALDKNLKGGYYLRKKPLEGCAPEYSYSDFAIESVVVIASIAELLNRKIVEAAISRRTIFSILLVWSTGVSLWAILTMFSYFLCSNR